MSDIRTRLIDALREANFTNCSYAQTVDLLLSLPGIAIVDTEADLDYIAERIADADDGIIYGLLTPDEADFYQRMAYAALKAAANTAEVDES